MVHFLNTLLPKKNLYKFRIILHRTAFFLAIVTEIYQEEFLSEIMQALKNLPMGGLLVENNPELNLYCTNIMHKTTSNEHVEFWMKLLSNLSHFLESFTACIKKELI